MKTDNPKASKTDLKIKAISDYLVTKGMSLKGILKYNSFSFQTNNIKHVAKVITKYFTKITLDMILDDTLTLPIDTKDWGLERQTEKIRTIDNYLTKEKNLQLYRSLSISESYFKKILEGNLLPSKRILKIVADYFYLDDTTLTDDSVELPQLKQIKLDE